MLEALARLPVPLVIPQQQVALMAVELAAMTPRVKFKMAAVVVVPAISELQLVI
jgi:hypothetical protein